MLDILESRLRILFVFFFFFLFFFFSSVEGYSSMVVDVFKALRIFLWW